jgi:hypothetical protein
MDDQKMIAVLKELREIAAQAEEINQTRVDARERWYWTGKHEGLTIAIDNILAAMADQKDAA